jgi:hypothetical protein
MVKCKTAFRTSKSFAGAALVALGMFILYQNVAGAVTELTNALGANGSGALGVVPAAALAFAKVLHAYTIDHQRFFQEFIRCTLVAFWPLLLVTAGTILSRIPLQNKSKNCQK